MQKILIIDNSSWNIYNFRKPLVKKLKAEGKTVVVVTPIDEYIEYLNEIKYIKHIPLKNLSPRNISPYRDLRFIYELIRIYWSEKPDLAIHFTIKPNIYGSLITRLFKVPTIAVVTGLGFTFLNPKGINSFIPLLYRIALKKIRRLVLYNKDDRSFFSEKKIVATKKCTVIPGSGVDTQKFHPKYNIEESRSFKFLFVGRLLKDKGLVEFVEATKSLLTEKRNFQSIVVGDFNEANPAAVPENKLLEWMQNEEIVYLGKVFDIRQILKKIDALVLPSYREGIPRVVLEAMAMGKPIITSNAAGCRETVVHGENGFIVPVKNITALSVAMSAMLDMQKKELDKMGKKSRQLVIQKFDDKIIVEKYIELLSELSPNSFRRNKPKKAMIENRPS